MDELVQKEELTPEQIQQHYNASLDSVSLINDIIAGTQMADASDEDKKSCVERNVGHLTIMVGKDYWQGQDMSPLVDAIADGQNYIA